jgi:6-phosphogluconolactonase (cycloisomerase 2 family)
LSREAANDSLGVSAYVYVSATAANTNRAQIYAFAAAPNGKLTPVGNSPFPYNVTFMATNGLYLFGSDASGTYIHAYQIGSNGSLRPAASTSVVQAKNGCDSAGALFLDHTGATIYNVDYYGAVCANAAYQAFAVEKTTGSLRLVDQAPAGMTGSILRFAANNSFAYGANCGRSNTSVYGYIRKSDGSLKRLDSRITVPVGTSRQSWCPHLAAADSTNHVAVAVYPTANGHQASGPYQLATYTQDDNGALTTASTSENMPKVAVGEVTDIYMSPSGKLLAVAGTNGLQIFRFNGSNPVTPFTGLLTRQEVDQMFWDNNDHLYALSQAAGKLWVFTATEESLASAPGSPWSIPGAQNIVVQPWPLPWNNSEPRAAQSLRADERGAVAMAVP